MGTTPALRNSHSYRELALCAWMHPAPDKTLLHAGAQPEAAPAPAPAAGGPAANTQFTLLAANASFTVAADNTTTLALSGALPTVVYTQSAPVRDVGCAPLRV